MANVTFKMFGLLVLHQNFLIVEFSITVPTLSVTTFKLRKNAFFVWLISEYNRLINLSIRTNVDTIHPFGCVCDVLCVSEHDNFFFCFFLFVEKDTSTMVLRPSSSFCPFLLLILLYLGLDKSNFLKQN